MATPANRVPVRIARGSKANLDTAIAAGDLNEGEICYATDENGIYVVEGGVLTQSGADLNLSSIDALSDVDTTTAAPTDGQVLIWNNVDGEWEPGDLSIDSLSDVDTTTAAPVDGQALIWNNSLSQWEPGGVSGEIEWTLTANATTDYIFAGPGFAGTETDPVVYVVRGQTYKFTNTMGAHPFQIQSTSGIGGTAYNDGITNNAVSNGTLTWEVRMDAPSTLYYQCTSHAAMNGTIYVLDEGSAVASIDDLTDVDTSTVPPTDGQALIWDNANSKWEPGTVASGSVASLDDIGDVDTTTVPPTDGQALVWDNANSQWEPGTVSGGGAVTSVNTLTGAVSLGIEDLDDFELNPGTFPYWATKEGTGTPAAGEWYANGTNLMRANPVDSNGTDWSTEMTALGTTGTFWHSTDAINWTQTTNSGGFDNLPTWFQFNLSPFNVSTHTGGLYISFSDPASNPGAPLADGDILQYVSADSKFKPVTESSLQAVTSVNTLTGAVSLGIEEMDDFYLPTAYVFDTYITPQSPNEPGQYHFQGPGTTNNLAFAKEDANSLLTSAIKDLSIGSTLYLNGVAFTTDGAGGEFSSGGSVGSWFLPITEDLSSVATTGLTITLEPSGAQDGEILQYSSTDSAYKPIGASGVRTLLGIEEYADDTAAGSGGLVSGEMYYNTTSSSYVLKT